MERKFSIEGYLIALRTGINIVLHRSLYHHNPIIFIIKSVFAILAYGIVLTLEKIFTKLFWSKDVK